MMLLHSAAVSAYHIGTKGAAWGAAEKAQWLAERTIKRSYADEVLAKLDALRTELQDFEVVQYGALPIDPARYPLFAVRSREWVKARPCVLVTGGVHGYETSGVQGALAFLRTEARAFASTFNILVAPCVSPWGYEHIQRWNADAVDPNRSFGPGALEGPAEESAALLRYIASLGDSDWKVHLDLHETTDTDESEFRPAKSARNGEEFEPDTIPDGFYLVGDAPNPQPEFQRAIIEEVAKVTHIAPPDAAGNIIGEPIVQEGVIVYDAKSVGLCMGATNAHWATTTEVYPDSPRASDQQCNDAQVASVRGALTHVMRELSLKAEL